MMLALVLLAMLVLVAVALVVMSFYGMREVRALVLRDVDLSRLADGVYLGSYHKGRWTYDVEVTVKDHRLVSIVNTNARMNTDKDWNEKAAHAMLGNQTVRIDVVSGATLNTKAFGRSVERTALAAETAHLEVGTTRAMGFPSNSQS
jgi:uncharacterized protein with FMN-binding domain